MSNAAPPQGYWQASDGRWYPPPAPAAYPASHMPVQVIQVGNGMAVAALVLGIVGLVFGLIPLFFFISLPCGILGLTFGLVGRRKSKRLGGHRKGMALAGTILGASATLLGVIGIAVVANAANKVDRCIDAISQDINTGGNAADSACN